MDLSEEQRKIVDSTDRHVLVVAGAGCGKTTTLVHYIMKRALDPEAPKTVVLTFSNKAARDVREKIGEIAPELFDRLYVGTIHSFCLDMFRRYGHLVGMNPDSMVFESFEDRIELFSRALVGDPSEADRIRGLSDRERRSYIERRFSDMSSRKRTLDFSVYDDPVIREYNDMLKSMDVMDYDDIIIYGFRIISECPKVAEIYQVYYGCVCVDEAQDLNPSQYAFVKALASDVMNTFLVGDPNQAIYGFAGASSDFMCVDYPRDFDVRRFELRDNYRLSRAVMEAAQILEPEYRPEGRVPIEGEFTVTCYDDDDLEAEGIAGAIRVLLADGHPDVSAPTPEGIAVISRRRTILEKVAGHLADKSIRCVIRSAGVGPSFDSDLMNAIWLSLRVNTNPKDSFHRSRLDEVMFTDHAEGFDECVARVVRVLSGFDTDDMGVLDEARREIERYAGTLVDENEFGDITGDLEVWDSLTNDYLMSTSPGGRSLEGLMSTSSMRNSGTSDGGGVVLSTVHMSKGLEFDVVFIASVNEGILPDYRSRSDASLAEEKHNLFVSITRARRVCRLSFVRNRKGWRGFVREEPSRFIQGLIDRYL